MNTPTAPCAGNWLLFDSTDVRDHHEARALCQTCPVFAACLDTLATARKEATEPRHYGPEGTWAGQLIRNAGVRPRTSAIRVKAEDEMFSEADARAAHANYAAGFRDSRSVVGERVYNRRKKRAQYARNAAA